MLIFLLLLYVGLLALLIKLKIIKLTLWWKISPLLYVVGLLFVLFIPMQFTSPTGGMRVVRPVVEVVPNVSGQVTEIFVTGGQLVQKGDPLFQIDPVLFQARVDQLNAQRSFAKADYIKEKTIFDKGHGAQLDVDRAQAILDEISALLDEAQYNLIETMVLAPMAGKILNADFLKPGVRVINTPLRSTMAIMDMGKPIIAAQIHQIYLRHVAVGQAVEVTFKYLPGKVFSGTVTAIADANSEGQVSPTGLLQSMGPVEPVPLLIRIELDEQMMANIPAGSVGAVAIYTGKAAPLSIIRKVIIRMDAYMNYIIPF